jgi:hypothetical protein
MQWTKLGKKIMTQLSAGNIAAFDGSGVTSDELQIFFELLGGAQMATSFQCRQTKGERGVAE